ncbi:MAG: AarF/ABC1/UbiB kinase family protein [Leptospirales bacterium]
MPLQSARLQPVTQQQSKRHACVCVGPENDYADSKATIPMKKNENKNKNDDLISSAFGRALELGGLATRMGASFLGGKIRLPFVDEIARSDFLNDIYIREAERLVERLSHMKGAAMKFGQMLSVMDGMGSGALPPEVARILSRLQKDAQPLSFDTIEPVITEDLGERRRRIAEIDQEALACASIGQVHRARMDDGREIVLKVQYPDMPRIVRSDIKNLKVLASPFAALFGIRNMEQIWREVEDRLHEELDYEREARHIKRMFEHHGENGDLVLPAVIDEVCGPRVLAMTYVPGLSGEAVFAESVSQRDRDRWGEVLAKTMLENLFVHRFMHADPNFGNFAFQNDGRVVLYDFGCVKQVPEALAAAYGKSARAMLEDQLDVVPPILREAGIGMKDGSQLGRGFVVDHAKIFRAPFRAEAPYFQFGSNPELNDEVWRLAREYWYESLGIEFPADILMIHRTLAGTMGNLSKMRATADWRGILSDILERAGY